MDSLLRSVAKSIMQPMFRTLALLTILLFPAIARAEPAASCSPLFVKGQAPALINARLAERTQSLYYRAYAVLDSGITRGALWSAEHPTADGLAAARQTRRVNLFHPDDDLLPADRAELADHGRFGSPGTRLCKLAAQRGHIPGRDRPKGSESS